MKSILKSCMFLLFTLTLTIHAVKASSTQPDNALPFALTETASMSELDNARAREGIDINSINNVNIRAALTDNTANNNVTGTNNIDNGAFANSAGLFSVIQNTGNNVIIQDSTSINVTILP